MLGLTAEERAQIAEVTAGVCGEHCVFARDLDDSENEIVDRLIAQGRLVEFVCLGDTGNTHAQLTATGLEAVRIYDALQALEGVAA
jgi:hypothetical protein